MKFVLIVYNAAIDEELMEVLKGCGIVSYTKWRRVFGTGGSSGSHLGTSVWPGENNALAVACEDDSAKNLMKCIRDTRSKLGKEGVKAFVLPLEEVT